MNRSEEVAAQAEKVAKADHTAEEISEELLKLEKRDLSDDEKLRKRELQAEYQQATRQAVSVRHGVGA